MKSKLIQCATLLVFVMTIVFMAQAPNGFGHGLGGDHTNMDHPPQFEVDYWTGRPCPPFIYSVDPRSNTDYSGSSGNGTGSASSWALRYYASPLYNGYGGQVYDPNEANAEQINAKRTREAQMVFGVRVDLSASAGNSSCSGSVTPNVTRSLEMGLTTAGKLRLGYQTQLTNKKSGGIDVEVGRGLGKVTGKWTVGSEISITPS